MFRRPSMKCFSSIPVSWAMKSLDAALGWDWMWFGAPGAKPQRGLGPFFLGEWLISKLIMITGKKFYATNIHVFTKTNKWWGLLSPGLTINILSRWLAELAEATRPGGPQKPDYVRCGPQTKLRSLGATITLLYFLGNLVRGLEHGFYFPIYWEESFQLTFIFFRGVGIPPTRNISTVIGYKPTYNWGGHFG